MSDTNFVSIVLMLLAIVAMFGVTIIGLEVWEFFTFKRKQ